MFQDEYRRKLTSPERAAALIKEDDRLVIALITAEPRGLLEAINLNDQDRERKRAHQIIFREGDQSSLFYLLQSGKVSLEVLVLGKVARIQTLGEGDELGWSSIFSGGRKQFQARALGAVRALAFDGAQLQAACEEDPVFGYALLKRLLGVVAERLQATRMQLMDMYSSSGVEV